MRHGFVSAGNLLVDHVKIISRWPEQGRLCVIEQEVLGTGGAPLNVLMDMARFDVGLPLWAVGRIGDDADGRHICRRLDDHGIDRRWVVTTPDRATSFTDVMTVRTTGARTFFHAHGANALLDIDDMAPVDAPARIFHLGYLLLLERLDRGDPDYGSVGARVLHDMKCRGYETSLDVVSVDDPALFRASVVPALRHTDYLIVNELEAADLSGVALRTADGIDRTALPAAAHAILELGACRLVVIHYPEGCYAAPRDGRAAEVASYTLDPAQVRGTVGAGDAFCAGVLYGLHEGLALDHTLAIANASARFNLLSPTAVEGCVPMREIEAFVRQATPAA